MNDRAQRLRITFAREEEQKYITHLDLMRAWERILKRAEIPVTLSQGYTPRPRIALAAPLAVGVTSECELLELICAERISVTELADRLRPQLPRGIRILAVREIAIGLPSLQSLVRAVEYVVEVADGRSHNAWQEAIDGLLSRQEIPWEHQRGDEVRRYDLRPLVLGIELLRAEDGKATLRLRLRSDESGTGRPEQVTRALGVAAEPLAIRRTRLQVEEPSLARAAYRAAGRLED